MLVFSNQASEDHQEFCKDKYEKKKKSANESSKSLCEKYFCSDFAKNQLIYAWSVDFNQTIH